jgi:hypothetical protein
MYSRKNKRPKLSEDLKINTIKFFYSHGMAATVDCFSSQHGCKISKSTIYSWKAEYDQFHDHGRLHTSLAPKSRRPKRVRISHIDIRIINEIVRLRHNYPIVGKAKLYHLLIPFCEANGVNMIS